MKPKRKTKTALKAKALKTIKLIPLLLAALLVFTAACGTSSNTGAPHLETGPGPAVMPAGNNEGNNGADAQEIGNGAKVFRFEAVDGDGNLTAWNVHTDKMTVGDALVEVGLIEGTQFDFGLMVDYVNGIRADFMEDGAYWALFIGDDMAMVGVDAVDIEEGKTYAFIYTEA